MDIIKQKGSEDDMMTEDEIKLAEIGKRITERRKKLGLTQEALAEKGGLTPQFVSYAEAGKRAMRWRSARIIC